MLFYYFCPALCMLKWACRSCFQHDIVWFDLDYKAFILMRSGREALICKIDQIVLALWSKTLNSMWFGDRSDAFCHYGSVPCWNLCREVADLIAVKQRDGSLSRMKSLGCHSFRKGGLGGVSKRKEFLMEWLQGINSKGITTNALI